MRLGAAWVVLLSKTNEVSAKIRSRPERVGMIITLQVVARRIEVRQIGEVAKLLRQFT